MRIAISRTNNRLGICLRPLFQTSQGSFCPFSSSPTSQHESNHLAQVKTQAVVKNIPFFEVPRNFDNRFSLLAYFAGGIAALVSFIFYSLFSKASAEELSKTEIKVGEERVTLSLEGTNENASDKLSSDGKLRNAISLYQIDDADKARGLTSSLEKALWCQDFEAYAILKNSGIFPPIEGPLNIRYADAKEAQNHYQHEVGNRISFSPKPSFFRAFRINDINAVQLLLKEMHVREIRGQCPPRNEIQRLYGLLELIDFSTNIKIPYESIEAAVESKYIYKFPVIFYYNRFDKLFDKRLIEIGLKTTYGEFIYVGNRWHIGPECEMINSPNALKEFLLLSSSRSIDPTSVEERVQSIFRKHNFFKNTYSPF